MMTPDESSGAMADGDLQRGSARTESDLFRIVVCEALGSGLLAFIIVAAGILGERYALHNVGLALLITALAGACGFYILIRSFGAYAPCMFNPALALAFAVTGRVPIGAALSCAAAQIAASCLGVMIANLITNTGLIQVATQIQAGPGVWTGEFLGTALFVFALLMVSGREGERQSLVGAASLLAIALATPSTSFANPALTLGRTLTNSFTAIRLSDAIIIAGVQMVGALAAWLLCRWLKSPSPQ